MGAMQRIIGGLSNFRQRLISEQSPSPGEVNLSQPETERPVISDDIFAREIHMRLRGATKDINIADLGFSLGPILRFALQSGSPLTHGRHATQFPKINRYNSDLYELTLNNNQCVTRTREETELHILLQSHLRQFDVTGHADGDALDISSLRASQTAQRDAVRNSARNLPQSPGPNVDAVVQPERARVMLGTDAPRGDSTSADSRSMVSLVQSSPTIDRVVPDVEPVGFVPPVKHQPDDYSARQHCVFSSKAIDMHDLDTMLCGASHLVKEIAGANSDCWWRCAWASAIQQHHSDPALFEQTLRASLGHDLEAELEAEIAQARQMADSCRSGGMHEILTGMELANKRADFECPSRLKLPGTEDLDGAAGEEALRKLTDALMSKAGVPDDVRASAVYGDGMGEDRMVSLLMHLLGANCVIYSRPWRSAGKWDVDASTLTICPVDGGRLSALEYDENRTACSENVINELDTIPALINRGAHYNLCYPRHAIWHQYPS